MRRSRTSTGHRSFPTVGQCFDIEVTRETNGWLVRIPEIAGVTRARQRATVELAARKCIATRTGIPIGYVAVFVASEIG
ncbi:MAG: long chain fatty acid-CoA synthetase Faa4p [Mycobacterium sp.]